jgi:hypothetical protein
MAEFSAQDFTRRVRPIALANRGYSKIFGIGANKTGTTSLEAILRLYGFHLPHEMEQKMRLSKQTCLGNYEPLPGAGFGRGGRTDVGRLTAISANHARSHSSRRLASASAAS